MYYFSPFLHTLYVKISLQNHLFCLTEMDIDHACAALRYKKLYNDDQFGDKYFIRIGNKKIYALKAYQATIF